MTTIYKNNYVFPQEYIGSKSAKQQMTNLTNYTSLVFFNYLPPCLSFWLSFLLLKIGIYSKHSPYKRHSWHKTDLHIGYKRIKCQCSPHIVTSQLICCVNQLIGFYIRATLTFNGLSSTRIAKQDIYIK